MSLILNTVLKQYFTLSFLKGNDSVTDGRIFVHSRGRFPSTVPVALNGGRCYLLVPHFRKTEHAPSRSFLPPLSLSGFSLSTVSLSSRIHRAISDFLDPRGFGEGGEGGTCGIEAGEGNRRTKPR